MKCNDISGRRYVPVSLPLTKTAAIFQIPGKEKLT
jgi:hypothetical protein